MNGASDIPAQPATPGIADTLPAALTLPPLVEPLFASLLERQPDYRRYFKDGRPDGALKDFIIATSSQPHRPADIAPRLRWGGLLFYSSRNPREAADLARQFECEGFSIEEGPCFVQRRFAGLVLPLLSRKHHYFLARKVQLLPPGQLTERFTYHVQLVPHPGDPGELVVQKEVPSFESVVWRLQKKFPDVLVDVIERRAHKFVDKIFPTFLTREAAMLKILEEHLPRAYARRVPRVIDLEQDEKGFVRKFRMTWLRNGGKPLSHLEFAYQSADLLRVIHDIAHIIHLDLRLDNFVVTENGIGFVDFGSAVREDENLRQNPMLDSLFEELMRTSQIQRMLFQMTLSGHVTSDIIRQSHQKVDKAIDFFYLAIQFNSPHANPDLTDLIAYTPKSQEARYLSRLTAEILRPANPAQPVYRSAKDILYGVERIQKHLAKAADK
jgi:tRNA A-37 threonylcarbamoyl transferase component Bud32